MKLKYLLWPVACLLAILTSAWTPEEIDFVPSTPSVTWEDRWAAEGVEITANLTVHRCLTYLPIVRGEHHVDLDDELVLALMAAESACDRRMDDGMSVGLMAVTPRAWTPTHDELLNPAINVEWGEWLLWSAIYNEKHNPGHNIWRALAAYNCGWESLDAGKCIDGGGYDYANDVLNFWLPRFLP